MHTPPIYNLLKHAVNEEQTMTRISVSRALFPILGTLFSLGLSLNAFGFEISIDVAPNVLNIQSQGDVVSVHTDIAYGAVQTPAVFLNDVQIAWWKVDNRGNFVAKFWMDEIKDLDGLIIGDYNLLTLTGVTTGGEAFFGEALIMVIDNVPSGKTTPGSKTEPVAQPGQY
jgi:hypothetical protein